MTESGREGHTALHVMLSAIGAELGELGRCVDGVQLSLSPAMRHLALDAACHKSLQSLDMLSQRLAALSAYAIEISALLPESLALDSRRALAAIKLSALQDRLQGTRMETGHAAGEAELF